MHYDGDDGGGDVGCLNVLLLRPLRGSRSLLERLVVGHFVGCSYRLPSFARRRFRLVDMAVENRAALGIPCLTVHYINHIRKKKILKFEITINLILDLEC